MSVTVILDDFSLDKRSIFFFSDAEFSKIDTNWEKSDVLLVELNKHELFKNCNRWCDLKPLHYKLMIIKNLSLYNSLTEIEKEDYNNPVVASLLFLIAGMIKSIETRADTSIELFKIQKINEFSINFEYTGSLNLQSFGNISKNISRDLKIVVDNTKHKDEE